MASAPRRAPSPATLFVSLTAAVAMGASALVTTPPASAAPTPPSSIAWAPCAGELVQGLDCGQVTVPLNHDDPTGPTISVGVYRVSLPAGTPRPAKVLFVNPGGPGGESSSLVLQAALFYPPEVLKSFDVIGVDPRGIGSSTHLTCADASSDIPAPLPDQRPFPASRLQEQLALSAAFTKACFDRSPELAPYISTVQTVRDFDVVRARLGVQKASFVGYSYGTVLFSSYARQFPQHVDRLVLDSAVYGRDWGWEVFEDRAPRFEARFEEFATWAAGLDDLFGLGASRSEVLAGYDRVIAALDEPGAAEAWGIGAGDVRGLVTSAAFSSASYPLAALLLAVVEGVLDGSLPLPEASAQARRALAAADLPDDSGTATSYAVACNDGPFPHDAKTYASAARKAERHYPRIGAVQVSPLPCATWPLELKRPLPVSRSKTDLPALVVQSVGDRPHRTSRA